MMEHIEAALTRDGMASLVQAVAAVLNASQWKLNMMFNPDDEARLVSVLQQPFQNYASFKGVISMDEALQLSRASISIARALMREHIPIPSFFLSQDNESLWQSYLQLQPKIDSEQQQFIDAILAAPLVSHDVTFTTDDSGEIHADDMMSAEGLQLFCIPLDDFQIKVDREEEEEVPLKDQDEKGNRVMYMVRLPVSIPTQLRRPCSDTLFVTRDDLALFTRLRSLPMSVLLGNPGIGKSWFQFIYLLFLVRPDVYSGLSGLSMLPPNDQQSHVSPRIVMRVIAEDKAHVFFLEGTKIIVHRIEKNYVLRAYNLLNSENTLMMIEPGRTRTPIPYEGLDRMQILATVSPDTTRYKEFCKNGGTMCFKPCPSACALLAMGAVMRPCVTDALQSFYASSSIMDRIRTIGPFQRYVLPASTTDVVDQLKRFDSALASLSEEKLMKLAFCQQLFDNDNIDPTSHWFMRYEVDREQENPYFSASQFFVPTTKNIMNRIRTRLAKMSLQQKIEELIKLNNEGSSASDASLAREWLEDVFAAHASSEKWTSKQIQSPRYQIMDSTLLLQFKHVVQGSVQPWSAMAPETLYYRIDPFFPFVDGVWKQNDQLFAFQATTSSKHPKTVATFCSFLERIGLDKDANWPRINIVYVLLPRTCGDLFWSNINLLPSFFWINILKDKPSIEWVLQKDIMFWITCPPDNF
jgi:hypothetical protein